MELASPSQRALFETLLAELGTGGISCRELSDADWELVLRTLWSSAFVSKLLLNQDPTLKSQMPDAPPHALADMGASDWPLRAFTAWTGVLHCIQQRYHLVRPCCSGRDLSSSRPAHSADRPRRTTRRFGTWCAETWIRC